MSSPWHLSPLPSPILASLVCFTFAKCAYNLSLSFPALFFFRHLLLPVPSVFISWVVPLDCELHFSRKKILIHIYTSRARTYLVHVLYTVHCCAVLCHLVVSDSLWPHGLLPIRLLCSWGCSMQECWSGLPCPSPGVLPNPRIKPRSCKWILYCLSQQGSPWILEWIAYPFSRGSSQPRNRTGVSCIAGGFFISCATREAL